MQGGRFLRSALSTAAGVAGGMLVTDGLRELFGGGRAQALGNTPSTASSADAAALRDADRTQGELQDQVLLDDADIDSADDENSDSDNGMDV